MKSSDCPRMMWLHAQIAPAQLVPVICDAPALGNPHTELVRRANAPACSLTLPISTSPLGSPVTVAPAPSAPSAPAPSAPAQPAAAHKPAPAAAEATKVSELRGTTVPFTAMQNAVSKNMVNSLAVCPLRILNLRPHASGFSACTAHSMKLVTGAQNADCAQREISPESVDADEQRMQALLLASKIILIVPTSS